MKKSNQSRSSKQEKTRARMERELEKAERMQTISGLRRIINRMQFAGVSFLVIGLLMPKISPYYAEKTWNTLIGVKLSLPNAVVIFGIIMVIVSIVCFLKSYRCAKCRGLLALTPYKKPVKCRSCGTKLTDKDIFRPGGE